jgi:hypothetical protein
MKTTLDIHDELILRAKKLARRSGRPLRAVVEQGLRLALADSKDPQPFEWEDHSYGDVGGVDPLEAMTWQDLRAEIYSEPSQP